MSTRRHREFSLRDIDVLEVLMADNSDDEDGLTLDEEDQQFLAQDIDAGISTVEIEPSISPSVEERRGQQEMPQMSEDSSFNWRKNSYVPYVLSVTKKDISMVKLIF